MTTTTTTTPTPAAWVGCLACYNAGRLAGEWMDADALTEFVEGGATPCGFATHDEFWCFDTEWLGNVGECSPVDAAQRARAMADTLEDAAAAGIPAEVIAAAIDAEGISDPDGWRTLVGRYYTQADTRAEFAQMQAEDFPGLDELPSWMHIDWDSTGHDLEMDYTVVQVLGRGRWYFETH